ncbi:MAG TPA: hypothetical protein VFR81_18925, partial [Longimicrobium sp.]|nr:hypothetical protein [Longimicrobium sp.]
GVVFWHDKVSSTGVHVTRSPRRVVGIERGGSLVAVEQRGERRRELRVTRGPDGSPVYGYTVNGRGQPFEGEARAWLDAILATRFPAAPPPRPAS